MKEQYDASTIIELDYKPLVDSFMNRTSFQLGINYRGHYTNGDSLFICGCEIARFKESDLQIKIEPMIGFGVYNLIPNVNLLHDYPISKKVYFNGIEITDFDNWIFVKNGN